MDYLNLITVLATALQVEPSLIEQHLTRSKTIEHGEWSLPCFPFARGTAKKPHELAQELATSLPLPSGIGAIKPVGPYLNFYVDRQKFARDTVGRILSEKLETGRLKTKQSRIVIDYSSPNIAKVFHVGHLRTTLIGQALYRVFQHCNHDVIGINHLGDWGTQFGFVWAGKELWGLPSTASVDDLVDIYVKAAALRKAQEKGDVSPEDQDKPDVNEMARDYFLRLESNEPEAVAFWRWCLDISLTYFKAIYQRLGIEFDYYTGESFYRTMLGDVENVIRESGILEDSEGAQGVSLNGENGFVRIFAEDGRSLYITRDIAAAFYRHTTFHPEKTLYVVGAAQSLHFQQLKGILEKLNHPAAEEIVHVPFGNVPGMKTRDGGAISLQGYLQEAKERALNAYREEVEKRPVGLDEDMIAEQVAIGATYFYFLSHSNIKDFHFSWKQALNFQGDSGPYLQYALSRLHGIERRAREQGIELNEDYLQTSHLTDDTAHELVVLLSRFDEVLTKVRETYEPSLLAAYALDIARTFSKAYQKLRVVDEDEPVAQARLALFRAVRYVLHLSLHLIGVPPVERM
jgi:arginyl-tRNA synthetase